MFDELIVKEFESNLITSVHVVSLGRHVRGTLVASHVFRVQHLIRVGGLVRVGVLADVGVVSANQFVVDDELPLCQ